MSVKETGVSYYGISYPEHVGRVYLSGKTI